LVPGNLGNGTVPNDSSWDNEKSGRFRPRSSRDLSRLCEVLLLREMMWRQKLASHGAES
jgi:hypothetical protein